MADGQYTFPALVAGTASSYCGKAMAMMNVAWS